MFRIVPENLYVDFLGKAKSFLMLSGLLILVSFGSLIAIGPNYGIDFKGGTDIIMHFAEGVTADEVRSAATEAGFPDANVQKYGTEGNQFLIQTSSVSVVGPRTVDKMTEQLDPLGTVERIQWSEEQPDRMDVVYTDQVTEEAVKVAIEPIVGPVELETAALALDGAEKSHYVVRFEDLQGRITEGFERALGDKFDPKSGIDRLETVGPRVGKQLRDSGILSIFVALLLILIYIAFRFDVRYAPGAVAALTHDVIIAIGFFTIVQMEISLPIIAALLTIIGYSLNDTIVVFDRIRENLVAEGDKDVVGTVNRAISETLSRTIITSLTTLLAVVSIYVLGGGLIKDFALALIVGIIIGTYSSVFVASPVMVFMDSYLKTRKKSQVVSDRTSNRAEMP